MVETTKSLRAVLERPSQIMCSCGHIAGQHGAACLHCDCPTRIHDVMTHGYLRALPAALKRLEAAENMLLEVPGPDAEGDYDVPAVMDFVDKVLVLD